MSTIREDISQMKSQIDNLCSTTEYLALEHTKVLKDITELKTLSSVTEQKFINLEKDINAIKQGECSDPKIPPPSREDLICEIRERTNREKNIIIVGIVESHNVEAKDRISHDAKEVQTIIKELATNNVTPIKTMRLGKYVSGKNRPIKVLFNSVEIPKEIFRNKSKLSKKDIKIFSDQTPAQQSHMIELKNQLSKRQENGETDLTIKFIKGQPKIVTITKNFTRQ